jgi:hypothetical protein
MQLPNGAQWQRISGTAAGTTVVKASETTLYGVVIGQNKTGTVTFYDHASGTSATSKLGSVDNTCGTQPTSLDIGARMRNGIVAETGGTTDMLVIYQ